VPDHRSGEIPSGIDDDDTALPGATDDVFELQVVAGSPEADDPSAGGSASPEVGQLQLAGPQLALQTVSEFDGRRNSFALCVHALRVLSLCVCCGCSVSVEAVARSETSKAYGSMP